MNELVPFLHEQSSFSESDIVMDMDLRHAPHETRTGNLNKCLPMDFFKPSEYSTLNCFCFSIHSALVSVWQFGHFIF